MSKLDEAQDHIKANQDKLNGLMEDALERGEKLDTLEEKSEKLKQSGQAFEGKSRDVRFKMLCEKYKRYLMIFFALAALGGIIAIIVTQTKKD